MAITYVVLAVLHLACLSLRAGYEILKGRGRLNPKNPLVFTVIFAVMILLWASWFGLCPLDPLRIPTSETVHRTGLGLVIVGLALALGGMIKLKGVENIDRLETTGLYSFLRHPMYTGFILWIPGWILYQGAPASIFVGLLTIGNVLWWRRIEERELAQRYGKKFSQYKKQTWL
jgi:protein-S-isoprenylcysteine O-methyltransferase Ste14